MTDGKHIAVYDLVTATKGDLSKPLANFRQPVIKNISSTFQGYAAYGEFVYVLTGTSYTASGNKINSKIAGINLNTGAVANALVLTKAESMLSYREPEGLAYSVPLSNYVTKVHKDHINAKVYNYKARKDYSIQVPGMTSTLLSSINQNSPANSSVGSFSQSLQSVGEGP